MQKRLCALALFILGGCASGPDPAEIRAARDAAGEEVSRCLNREAAQLDDGRAPPEQIAQTAMSLCSARFERFAASYTVSMSPLAGSAFSADLRRTFVDGAIGIIVARRRR